MTIKLKGSTDGSVSFTAPADTSPTGSDITLTLPTTAGSANQFVKNSGTAGTLEYSSMIETSAGRIGIGTATPDHELDVRGNARIGQKDANDAELQIGTGATGDRPAYVDLVGDTTYTDYGARFIRGAGANAHSTIHHRGTGGLRLIANDDGPLTFATNSTESARISPNGELFVGYTSGGTTAHNNGFGVVKAKGYNTKSGVSGNLASNVFNVQWTSPYVKIWIDNVNIGTAATASDYRVKDNIVSITSNCIDRVKQLRPVQFEYTNYSIFSADGVTREGFIAHEVAEVIPSGAEGEKDDPNQIQSLKLDAILSVTVKALQEAIAKIETLETKVAALEAGS